MRIKKLSRLISVTLLFLTLASIASMLYSYVLFDRRKQYSDGIFTQLDRIRQFDDGIDRLTSSIRAYAATRSPDYLIEYTYERDGSKDDDYAMTVLRGLALAPAEIANLESAKTNANAIKALADRALMAMSRGDAETAAGIVFGADFERQKNRAKSLIRMTETLIQQRFAQDRVDIKRKITKAIAFSVAIGLASLVAIFLVFLVYLDRKIIDPVVSLTENTKKMMEGATSVSFDTGAYDSEVAELGNALETFRETRIESETTQWIKRSLSKIVDGVRKADTVETFSESFLDGLQEALGFAGALMYFIDPEDGALRLTAAWGLGPARDIQGGNESLVAEAARSLKPIVVDDVPAAYLGLRRENGQSSHATVMVLPLGANGFAFACVETMFFNKPGENGAKLVAELPEAIAPYLVALERAIRTRELLMETERQALHFRDLNNEQKAIFDAATTGIALLQNMTVIRANRKLEEILGCGAGRLTGQSCARWFPPNADWKKLSAERNAALARHGVWLKEMRMTSEHGGYFWGRVKITALDRSPAGRRYVCILEDITDERDSSEALRIARDAAEGAAKAKSEFLAKMSHEIRTPLNAIINFSRMALDMGGSGEAPEHVRKIATASEHLLGIVNEILDFSKIEAGMVKLENEPFNLETVLSFLAAVVNEKASAKGLELIFDVDGDVPRSLVGDSHRLGQILLNFASNAVKFTDTGEICVCVCALEVTEDRALLDFTVRDTGIGLTGEQQTRIFTSFEQADMSITRKYGGTGLGLSISKQLAEMMNGSVRVESEIGKGSTFGFTAPFARDRSRDADSTPGKILESGRVLVVDDNESARLILRGILTTMAGETEMADSGETAVEMADRARAEGKPYSFVFIDWKMPGIDGIKSAGIISSREAASGVPEGKRTHIVMLTAFDRSKLPADVGSAGIEAVLSKPVTPSVVLDTILKIMGRRPEEERRPPPKDSSLRERLSAIAGSRVLLVEDNDLNQEVGVKLLSDAGMKTDVAENGAVALEMLEKDEYDLVIMDMQMPEMDGITATRKIRERPSFASLPVIAMTANTTNEDKQTCLDAGMNDVVIKPIEPSRLLEALVSWIAPPQ